MRAIGVDIGGTSIKLAVVEDASAGLAGSLGTVIEETSSWYRKPDAAALRAALLSVATRAAGRVPHSAAGEGGVAIGVCAPGIVDPLTRKVTVSINLPGLVGTRLDSFVSETLLQARLCAGDSTGAGAVSIVSDARAAAHDWWLSRCPPVERGARVLAMSLGTGVGGCVLDDGVPLRVSGQSSGHFGQMDVSAWGPGGDLGSAPAPPIGPDGGAGSLEAYIGLPALLAAASQLPMGDAARGDIGRYMQALQTHDAPIAALCRALRIAHAIYRPQHIALLGGVGIRLAHLVAPMRAAIATNLTSLARAGWSLECGTSDFHASRGAARIAAAEARGAHDRRPSDGGAA